MCQYQYIDTARMCAPLVFSNYFNEEKEIRYFCFIEMTHNTSHNAHWNKNKYECVEQTASIHVCVVLRTFFYCSKLYWALIINDCLK